MLCSDGLKTNAHIACYCLSKKSGTIGLLTLFWYTLACKRIVLSKTKFKHYRLHQADKSQQQKELCATNKDFKIPSFLIIKKALQQGRHDGKAPEFKKPDHQKPMPICRYTFLPGRAVLPQSRCSR